MNVTNHYAKIFKNLVKEGNHTFMGVFGRPAPVPGLTLSEGFKIWNEHISVSSTDIIAPAIKEL